MKAGLGALTAALLLAACSQSNAPSEQMEKAAETLVERAAGEPVEDPAGPYAPRDECVDMAGIEAFRDKLAKAVAERDEDALVALAAQDIKLDFGGGGGRETLRERLEAEPFMLWEELHRLMELGCAKNSQGGITIPWYFAQDTAEDPYSLMIVTGEDVPLRSAPEGDAGVLETLSWQGVKVGPPAEGEAGYRKVTTEGGTEGYVASARLRSMLDYRLIASSRNGNWSITSLVAGD